MSRGSSAAGLGSRGLATALDTWRTRNGSAAFAGLDAEPDPAARLETVWQRAAAFRAGADPSVFVMLLNETADVR